MKGAEILERINRALAELMPIRGQLEGDLPIEIAMACGELAGLCVRLQILLDDEIDRKATRQ